MPRKPIDYSKGLIYQIEKDGIVYYVGSSTNFTNRKSTHKTSCNNENDTAYNYPIYTFIRNNGGWDEFKMVLIEYYKCNDANELTAREQHFMNEFKTHLLNTNYASRTREQYQLDNKEVIAIKEVKRYQDNKVEIAKYKQQHHIENRDRDNAKNAKYRQDKLADEDYQTELKASKAKHYQDNKPELLIKNANYYKNNKETIAIQGAKYREDNREAISIRRAKSRQDKLADEDYQKKLKAYKAKWYKEKKARKLQLNEIV